MPLRKQHIVYFAIFAAFVCVSIVFGMVYCGVSTSLKAERALHANLLVLDLVREYVVNHNGSWPRSWRDLENLPPRRRSMFQWPDSIEDVQRYVSVDFEADPDKLATQSVQEFVAVQPKGPCYPYAYDVAQLIEAIRRSRNGYPSQ